MHHKKYSVTFGNFKTVNKAFQIVMKTKKRRNEDIYIFLSLSGFVIGLNIYFNFTFR